MNNPEIGNQIACGSIVTNYHDVGQGAPVLLLHGSGPGVSAKANWRLAIDSLQDRFRMIAPDLAGFGYSDVPDDIQYTREMWLEQIVVFMDALGVEKAHVIGNSFGGSMALALAIAYPERVDKLILMGSVGVSFPLTEGLDAVWGYEPSIENMRGIMDIFAYDRSLVSDALVDMRYQASLRMQGHYSKMFPAPRQRWVEAMAHAEADIRKLRHQTLLVHGRDDRVIPLVASQTMLDWIDHSELHVFSRCGHWTQIEHARAFNELVACFLSR
jgi:2-hydroxymuconate-semialdehyde hydrolase